MDVAERFDREREELEDLARVGREGADPAMLRAHLWAEQDRDPAEWLLRPMTAPSRFAVTHQALVRALEQERAGLAQQEQEIAAVQARHAETPVGRPERNQLEAQALAAIAHAEQRRSTMLQLEQRLASTPNPAPLVEAARRGLQVLLPVALEGLAQSISAELEKLAQRVAGDAMDLRGALDRYLEVVAVAEQAAGQPLRVPLATYSARRALEAVGRARIEWSWSETSAGTVRVTTGNPVPEAR